MVIMDAHRSSERKGGLSLREAALVSDLAYLLNPVTFAEAYTMPRLIVASPTQTLANLHAHPHLTVQS